ncbi:MAG TPA: hypothetical protein DD456_10885 [Stenotrophomonas sp.]|nr:hypothetical protein [Stenotrophomonas sp.]
MHSDFLCRVLLWSLAFNYAVLLTWFIVFICARGALRRLHGRWFALPQATFDAIHYGGMAAYKIGILLFNLAPLAALWLAHGSG